MEHKEIKDCLSDIYLGHEHSLKLLEDGKEIPAYRKMQGTKDKLYSLLRRLEIKDT